MLIEIGVFDIIAFVFVVGFISLLSFHFGLAKEGKTVRKVLHEKEKEINTLLKNASSMNTKKRYKIQKDFLNILYKKLFDE